MTSIINIIVKTGTIAAMLSGVAVCATAQAASRTDDGAPRIAVKAAGYDLTSVQGVDALTARVRSSAKAVCATGSTDLQSLMNERDCYKHAMADAQAQIAELRVRSASAGGSLALVADRGPAR